MFLVILSSAALVTFPPSLAKRSGPTLDSPSRRSWDPLQILSALLGEGEIVTELPGLCSRLLARGFLDRQSRIMRSDGDGEGLQTHQIGGDAGVSSLGRIDATWGRSYLRECDSLAPGVCPCFARSRDTSIFMIVVLREGSCHSALTCSMELFRCLSRSMRLGRNV
jgi:hypothetical protein